MGDYSNGFKVVVVNVLLFNGLVLFSTYHGRSGPPTLRVLRTPKRDGGLATSMARVGYQAHGGTTRLAPRGCSAGQIRWCSRGRGTSDVVLRGTTVCTWRPLPRSLRPGPSVDEATGVPSINWRSWGELPQLNGRGALEQNSCSARPAPNTWRAARHQSHMVGRGNRRNRRRLGRQV